MAILVLIGSLGARPALAVPAFAIQTNQPCTGCHVGGFGPQLTPFGREFKLRGYTLRTNSFNLPISAMAIASYVQTQKDQPPPPTPHYGLNDNVTLDQGSLFVAGGLGQHFGGFVQTTYDGVARAFHWDNLDLRAVTTATIKGVDMVLGVSVNNAPSVQDPYNTLPAWGYNYTTSSLAPSPVAQPVISLLAQNTVGVTAYAWINSAIYAEAGGYVSPSSRFLSRAGIDPTDPGGLHTVAPYARLAYHKDFGDWNLEGGGFFMAANLYPGRDMTAGTTDNYVDLGLDGSYQLFRTNKDVITANARFTYEQQKLNASQALGLAANAKDHLTDLRADASYYWRDKIGVTAAAFDTIGSSDGLLYGADRTLKPNSSGLSLQLDATPFGGTQHSVLGPRFNVRLGVQCTAYLTFDGAGRNFDGSGHNASDNNTLRVFTWVAY